ncbi:MAG: hypothetical protein MK180_11800 [Rhodobacteraceae bacterium]|nr:hypothetical protein [Paracoccaceae bacterium]
MSAAVQEAHRGIHREALDEAIRAFGIEGSRELLRVTSADIRALTFQELELEHQERAFRLHKACGRLSLLGVEAPRQLSREIRVSLEAGRKINIPYPSRMRLLEQVQAAEAEVGRILDGYEDADVIERERKSNVMATLFTLTLCGYGGAAAVFFLTGTLWGALGGAFAGTAFWMLAVFVLLTD